MPEGRALKCQTTKSGRALKPGFADRERQPNKLAEPLLLPVHILVPYLFNRPGTR